MRKTSWIIVAVLAVLPAALAPALSDNQGFTSVQAIFTTSCSGCHDWAGSWEGITGGGHIVAGSLEKSVIWQKVSTDEMPQAGDKLTPDQKALLKAWILAGAPNSDQPIVVAAEVPATTATAPAPATTFLLFPDKVTFHEVTGFTSTALFLAAGVIGTVHFLDMMSAAHAYRNAIGFNEDIGPESLRIAEIEKVWGADSALRWWHVGFIISGEALYLGDALTGISMFTTPQAGKLTKHDIHRYAFFTHAALMAAQIGLGFAETYALSTGQHDLMIGLGAAHIVIGFAIPVVMLSAGLENLLLP
jgi:mono/diheme cytochrome c family protein